MDNKPAFISVFLELYRKYPCLWKLKDKDYVNKIKKDEAYGVLLEFYKTIFPTATLDTVKKKINNLRSAFRKELKKVKQSQSGSSVDEIYKPSLWYYELLLFTADQEETRETVGSEEMIFDNQEDIKVYDHSGLQPYFSSPTSPAGLSDSFSSMPSNSLVKSREPKIEKKRRLSIDATLRDNDEFDGIGINVACKLRRMDDEQKMHAEMLINKVLLHGLKRRLLEETDLTGLNFATPHPPVKVELCWDGQQGNDVENM